MLPRELPRQRVEIAHPLDRNQERFVGGESRIDQVAHLHAQVILEFGHVHAVDRLPVTQVGAPLIDLRLE
jgi:hypothetical protein